MRREAIAVHRHQPPVIHIGRLGLRLRRLFPHRPEGVEHLLVEVGGEVGPVEEMVVAGCHGRWRQRRGLGGDSLLAHGGRHPGECGEHAEECRCGDLRDPDTESTFGSGSVHGILFESAHIRLPRQSG